MTLAAYKGIAPQIPNSCYVDNSAVIYGDVVLGEDSSIWPLVAARGDV